MMLTPLKWCYEKNVGVNQGKNMKVETREKAGERNKGTSWTWNIVSSHGMDGEM